MLMVAFAYQSQKIRNEDAKNPKVSGDNTYMFHFPFKLTFFQISRKTNANKKYCKWTNEFVKKSCKCSDACNNTHKESVPIILCAILYAAKQSNRCYVCFCWTNSHFRYASGHPNTLNPHQGTVKVNQLKILERIGLGRTDDHVRRATYSLPETDSFKQLRDGEKKITGSVVFMHLRKGTKIWA